MNFVITKLKAARLVASPVGERGYSGFRNLTPVELINSIPLSSKARFIAAMLARFVLPLPVSKFETVLGAMFACSASVRIFQPNAVRAIFD
jgi:hypothetical protein